MILLPLYLALFLQTVQGNLLTCGNLQDAQTAPLRSAAGFTAVLLMHSEDDHGKNTHLCQTVYHLQISRPDGTTGKPIDVFGSDDSWDRPITFRIDGFSRDGNFVFLSISEGNHPSYLTFMEYDLRSGTGITDTYLGRSFTRHLSPACAATLHISGLTPAGQMILASSAKEGCPHAQQWKLLPNHDQGGRALPESPRLLKPDTTAVPLDSGQNLRDTSEVHSKL